MPWILDVLLQINSIVSKCGSSLTLSLLEKKVKEMKTKSKTDLCLNIHETITDSSFHSKTNYNKPPNSEKTISQGQNRSIA